MSKKTKVITAIIAFVIIATGSVFAYMKYSDTKESEVENLNVLKDGEDEATSRLKLINASRKVSIGEEMQFSTLKAKINTVKTSNTISMTDEYAEPVSSGNNAKFVIVNLTETNTTASPIQYDDFDLIGNNGKTYSSYDADMYIDNYMGGRELTPDIAETGNIVYKVPKDVNKFYLGGSIKDSTNGSGIFTVVDL